MVISLVGCGGRSDGRPGGDGQSTLATVTAEAAGPQCAAGGSKVSAGLDADADGVLDPPEVNSEQVVCHGAAGSSGAAGSAGAAGNAGRTSLVAMTAEAAGANCPAGGTKISVGVDADGNGVLDAPEVSSTGHVCQGAPGAAGANGATGANGANGAAGSPGLTGLMSIASEAPGANCAHGGSLVSSGQDANANGVLDGGEVTATSYTCRGAPGPGITWVDVTGAGVQADSNTGYIASSASQVVVTLPPSPAVGDLVQVSGAGAGGWKIAQNAGQSIIVQGLPGRTPTPGTYWTARESTRFWYVLAASADGNKLVAGEFNDALYTSTDAGVTWTARGVTGAWYAVASSADGSKLLAADQLAGLLYTSADSGVTWTPRESGHIWTSVASSADGSKLVAAASNPDQIFTSTDSGVTWTPRESARNWWAVASSSDGSKLVAAEVSGQIYTSTDSGVNWTARDSARQWIALASSADGSKLVATTLPGQIYTSSDSGVTWTFRYNNGTNWGSNALASSADGSQLVAAGDRVYTSSDSGVTWAPRTSARNWQAVATSADGRRLVAAENGGQLYTSPGDRTTVGPDGWLAGAQFDAITLQYVGGGVFMPLNATNHSGAFAGQ